MESVSSLALGGVSLGAVLGLVAGGPIIGAIVGVSVGALLGWSLRNITKKREAERQAARRQN